VPVVACVDGVKIQFYSDEHPPPHFHAEFAEFRAAIEIDSLTIMKGTLPPAKLRAVVEWASVRKEVLRATFNRAVAGEIVGKLS
jgi:hypothetical protein